MDKKVQGLTMSETDMEYSDKIEWAINQLSNSFMGVVKSECPALDIDELDLMKHCGSSAVRGLCLLLSLSWS